MQKIMRRLRDASGALVLVLMILSIGARPGVAGSAPQMTNQPQTTRPSSQVDPSAVGIPGNGNAASDPYKEKMDASRAKAVSDDRHKRLQDDSAKLLQMATDLKSEVDKTPKDELSLIVIRRATDIEKLAHDIREREKN